MQLEREPAWPRELHCYFPEWADRPDSVGRLLEADRNSYSAGGYSEEFGYTSADRAFAFAPLRGDPERSSQWCIQIGGLHPGYPECPRPADRGHDAGREDFLARYVVPHSSNAARGHQGVTRVLRVERRGAGRYTRFPVSVVAALRRMRIRRRGLGRVT